MINKENIISNKEILVYLFISMFLSIIESLTSIQVTTNEMLINALIALSYFYIHIGILLFINFIFKFIDIKNDKNKRIIKIILRTLAIIYILFLIFVVDFGYMLATADFGQ